MKKVTLTIATLLLAGSLFAQDFKPPAAANSALTAKHPTAQVEEWYDNETELICYFEENGNYGSAFFSPKGVWLRSEFSIDESDIDQSIMRELTTRYKGYEISEAMRVINSKTTLYKVYMYNPTTESDYLIKVDKGGKIISEENLTVEDDSFE